MTTTPLNQSQGYPTGPELYRFLRTLGLALPANFTQDAPECVDAASLAVAEFEQRVKWRPFLSDGNASEARTFDGPGASVLDLQGGILSIAGVSIAGQPVPFGVQQAGSGVTSLCLPKPDNAPARGLPYTSLAFGPVMPSGALLWGASDSAFLSSSGYLSVLPAVRALVTVTGTWGRVSAVPGDVRRAVLQRAAANLLTGYGIQLSGGLSDVKTEASDTNFGANPLGAQADRWEQAFEDAVRRYFRPSI